MRPAPRLPARCQARRPRHGAAAAELAILLPFLSLLLLGAIDFCRFFYYTQTLQNCASMAALYASGASTADASTTTTLQAAQQAAVAEGTTLQPPVAATNVNTNTTSATATATVTYSFSTLYVIPGLPSTWTITRSATLPMVPQPPGAGS